MSEFRKELEILLNRYSKENGSNTPEYILADFLSDCLASFDRATRTRSGWWGLEDPLIKPETARTEFQFRNILTDII